MKRIIAVGSFAGLPDQRNPASPACATLMTLVKEGHAVLHDEKAVRAIAQAIEILIHGCPPLTGGGVA